jgi:hypothetical protein
MRRSWPWLLVVLALSAGGPLPVALADGDPASDFLTATDVYFSSQATSDTNTLRSLVAASNKAGQPFKVALIATRQDLGSITALWGKPRQYVRFLAAEIPSYLRKPRKTLLIVMPAGVGVAGKDGTPAGKRAAAAIRVPANPSVGALARTAGDAMRAVARANGATLPAVKQAAAPSRPGKSHTELYILIGCALVALAGGGLMLAGARTGRSAAGAGASGPDRAPDAP